MQRWALNSCRTFLFDCRSFCYQERVFTSLTVKSDESLQWQSVVWVSRPDLMFFCRFHRGPAERREWTRGRPSSKHPLTHGSGQRYVHRCQTRRLTACWKRHLKLFNKANIKPFKESSVLRRRSATNSRLTRGLKSQYQQVAPQFLASFIVEK